MNPLYTQMNQVQPSGVMQRLEQFRQQFTGDPRQQIQQLLSSGRVSQAQYNQAYQMAQQLQRLMGR